MGVTITIPEDHGGAEIVRSAGSAAEVRPRRYREDSESGNWFYFRVANSNGDSMDHARISIEPCGDAGRAPLWSHNGIVWQRIPEARRSLEAGRLVVDKEVAPLEDLWIASAHPLPYGGCIDFIRSLGSVEGPDLYLARRRIGMSGQGRPIYAVKVIGPPAKKERRRVLLIAGLHPVRQSGKIMAQGVLRWLRLRGADDASAREILGRCDVYVVPLANPDGCFEGRATTNAGGVSMNARDDDSAEMRSLKALVDEIEPDLLLNAGGRGDGAGEPPHDGWGRWGEDDPLYLHVSGQFFGVGSGGVYELDEDTAIEHYAHTRYGTLTGALDLNWNAYKPADGEPVRPPTLEDLEARGLEYFRAVCEMP